MRTSMMVRCRDGGWIARRNILDWWVMRLRQTRQLLRLVNRKRSLRVLLLLAKGRARPRLDSRRHSHSSLTRLHNPLPRSELLLCSANLLSASSLLLLILRPPRPTPPLASDKPPLLASLQLLDSRLGSDNRLLIRRLGNPHPSVLNPILRHSANPPPLAPLVKALPSVHRHPLLGLQRPQEHSAVSQTPPLLTCLAVRGSDSERAPAIRPHHPPHHLFLPPFRP